MFKRLLELSYRSFPGNFSHNRSSAIIITENEREIYGVQINLTEEIVSPISNAICNAVSEGYIKFKEIYVFINSENIQKFILDDTAKNLLKEFRIYEIKLFIHNEEEHIIKLF